MKEMSPNEYVTHLTDAFPKEYFTGQEDFVFSKSALEDGLRLIEGYTLGLEETLEESTDTVEDRKSTLTHYLRKMQAIANILRRSLDGVRIQTSGE